MLTSSSHGQEGTLETAAPTSSSPAVPSNVAGSPLAASAVPSSAPASPSSPLHQSSPPCREGFRFATDEEIRTIAAYTNQCALTGRQKDMLMDIWIECKSAEERKHIAILYSKLFADVGFVTRLQARLMLLQEEKQSRARRAAVGSGVTGGSSNSAVTARNGGGGSGAANSLVGKDQQGHPLFGQQLLMLRKAVEDAVSKLSGPGPFLIEFGLVEDEEENREVIELFNSQFVHPDLADLQKMITVPKRMSTRSRQCSQNHVSLTWFIRSVTNNEICCAVSCHIHNAQRSMRFVEVPLFATRQGYQKMGLARLLTAGLKSYCRTQGMQYLLVSADPKAVPFWGALGFVKLEGSLRNRIDQSDCYDFKGSEVMYWKVPEGMEDDAECPEEDEDDNCDGHGDEDNDTANKKKEGNYVVETLKRMDKFLLRGPLTLPPLSPL